MPDVGGYVAVGTNLGTGATVISGDRGGNWQSATGYTSSGQRFSISDAVQRYGGGGGGKSSKDISLSKEQSAKLAEQKAQQEAQVKAEAERQTQLKAQVRGKELTAQTSVGHKITTAVTGAGQWIKGQLPNTAYFNKIDPNVIYTSKPYSMVERFFAPGTMTTREKSMRFKEETSASRKGYATEMMQESLKQKAIAETGGYFKQQQAQIEYEKELGGILSTARTQEQYEALYKTAEPLTREKYESKWFKQDTGFLGLDLVEDKSEQIYGKYSKQMEESQSKYFPKVGTAGKGEFIGGIGFKFDTGEASQEILKTPFHLVFETPKAIIGTGERAIGYLDPKSKDYQLGGGFKFIGEEVGQTIIQPFAQDPGRAVVGIATSALLIGGFAKGIGKTRATASMKKASTSVEVGKMKTYQFEGVGGEATTLATQRVKIITSAGGEKFVTMARVKSLQIGQDVVSQSIGKVSFKGKQIGMIMGKESLKLITKDSMVAGKGIGTSIYKFEGGKFKSVQYDVGTLSKRLSEGKTYTIERGGVSTDVYYKPELFETATTIKFPKQMASVSRGYVGKTLADTFKGVSRADYQFVAIGKTGLKGVKTFKPTGTVVNLADLKITDVKGGVYSRTLKGFGTAQTTQQLTKTITKPITVSKPLFSMQTAQLTKTSGFLVTGRLSKLYSTQAFKQTGAISLIQPSLIEQQAIKPSALTITKPIQRITPLQPTKVIQATGITTIQTTKTIQKPVQIEIEKLRQEPIETLITPTLTFAMPGLAPFKMLPFIPFAIPTSPSLKGGFKMPGQTGKQPFRYQAGVTARFLGITGKAPKTLTGLEFRPIVVKKEKIKKIKKLKL